MWGIRAGWPFGASPNPNSEVEILLAKAIAKIALLALMTCKGVNTAIRVRQSSYLSRFMVARCDSGKYTSSAGRRFSEAVGCIKPEMERAKYGST